MEEINERLFTWEPNLDNSKILRKSINQKMIGSLVECINVAEDGLETNLEFLKKKLQSIDTNKKLSSALFFYYSKLVEKLRYGIKEEVEDLIREILNLNEEDFYPENICINSILEDTWESDVIEGMRDEIKRDIKKGFDLSIRPLISSDIDHYKKSIRSSFEIVKRFYPEFYDELIQIVDSIKLFKGDYMIASSSFDTFGTIYVSIPQKNRDPVLFFLEHIFHELSHLQLYALMGLDKVILNNPEETYTSPLRPDSRPMYGIFHALFVLVRLDSLFTKIIDCEPKTEIEERFNKNRRELIEALKVVKENAKLTDKGKLILSDIEKYCSNIS